MNFMHVGERWPAEIVWRFRTINIWGKGVVTLKPFKVVETLHKLVALDDRRSKKKKTLLWKVFVSILDSEIFDALVGLPILGRLPGSFDGHAGIRTSRKSNNRIISHAILGNQPVVFGRTG